MQQNNCLSQISPWENLLNLQYEINNINFEYKRPNSFSFQFKQKNKLMSPNYKNKRSKSSFKQKGKKSFISLLEQLKNNKKIKSSKGLHQRASSAITYKQQFLNKSTIQKKLLKQNSKIIIDIKIDKKIIKDKELKTQKNMRITQMDLNTAVDIKNDLSLSTNNVKRVKQDITQKQHHQQKKLMNNKFRSSQDLCQKSKTKRQLILLPKIAVTFN